MLFTNREWIGPRLFVDEDFLTFLAEESYITRMKKPPLT
jgi:hypothetical protein